MKNLRLFSFLFIFSFFSSCVADDDTGPTEVTTNMTLNFLASYNGSPLVMYQPYDYQDDMKLKFSRFSYYISNVVLLKSLNGQSDETEILDIDYIDYRDVQDLASAEAGLTIDVSRIPVGNYKGIRFGIGVPADLNKTSPQDYSVSHSLAKTGEYWAGWESYIFSKIEGQADTLGNTTPLSFSYHAGSDELYREITLLSDISIKENETYPLKLDVDVYRLLTSNDKTVNIKKNPSDHQLDQATIISDNFEDAVKMQ